VEVPVDAVDFGVLDGEGAAVPTGVLVKVADGVALAVDAAGGRRARYTSTMSTSRNTTSPAVVIPRFIPELLLVTPSSPRRRRPAAGVMPWTASVVPS
jgi:hypothetical protein